MLKMRITVMQALCSPVYRSHFVKQSRQLENACSNFFQWRGVSNVASDISMAENDVAPSQIAAASLVKDGAPQKRSVLPPGPDLKHFLRTDATTNVSLKITSIASAVSEEKIPYLLEHAPNHSDASKKVYFEIYGCQMNSNDADIAWSILHKHGYQRTTAADDADVVLLMTCSIRESAEQTIWNRLQQLRGVKTRRNRKKSTRPALKVGLLGCMAERLKTKILDREKIVDVIAGPDAYRDLPRMLTDVYDLNRTTDDDDAVENKNSVAINTLLSADETYADIMPVHVDTTRKSPTAYLSIMRGCDNFCTFCIVPFVRGTERSRPVRSVVEEVHALAAMGVKEITLLGQNVNSYRDLSEQEELVKLSPPGKLSRGFRENYRAKKGGLRFADLLDRVSSAAPEMRFRFTSPHPKDFPDDVLQIMRERPNLCKLLHMPAQSGNSQVLETMRRGYTREAYIELIDHVRSILPDVGFTSDFIAGFCGESEHAHRETLSLIERVRYQFVYHYPYSMRAKTKAYHRLVDDVAPNVKQRRHIEIGQTFRPHAEAVNREQRLGTRQLVLIESDSKRSGDFLMGRIDSGVKCILEKTPLLDFSRLRNLEESRYAIPQPGDYVAVHVTAASSQTLHGVPLYRTSLSQFYSAQSA